MSRVVAAVDDLKCDYSLVEGRHFQADAPSMFPIAGITHWLVAQVPNKAGIHVLTFQFAVPYTQDVTITPPGQGALQGRWSMCTARR
mgnify:CR=1 FL=1